MKTYLLLFSLLLVPNLLIAQNLTASGTVISKDDGDPLPGVAIAVKGTTVGTVTDIDGKFFIPNVPVSATVLSISYLGMETQEVTIGNDLRIFLAASAQALDEVVVIAYGTAKRSSLTGSISSITAEKIEKRPVTNVVSALEGAAPGIQVNSTYGEPGTDPSVQIRGFSTVNGSDNVLYVVDGVIFGGNISDLNPQDIESLSILKDAASAALFGNRAANGVVLITTKKGKSDRINVRFNMNQGVFNRGLPEYNRLGADEWMETMWTGYRNSLITNNPDTYSTIALANEAANRSFISDIIKYNPYNKGDTELFDANGKLTATMLPHISEDLDWYKLLERTGHRQEYNMSGDGGSEKSNYYFSAGYLDEKGYLKMSDFQRFTGRATVNLIPKKWFKTGFTINGSHQQANYAPGSSSDASSSSSSLNNPFNFARNVAPVYPVYQHDTETGNYILDANKQKQYDDGEAYSRPQYLGRHIIWESELDMRRYYRNTMNGQLYADITFLNDFVFTIRGGLNLRNQEDQTYNNSTIGDGKGLGRASRTMNRYKNYTFQQQLNWNKTLNDVHSLSVLAGHENYSYNRSYTYGYKVKETFAGQTELINFNEITNLNGYQHNYRTESYLSRVRYGYDDRFFGEVSFRRDGSSRFHPDNRWGNFWSAGGSWNMSSEKWMVPYTHIFSNLKLRTSYGEVGNDAGVDYYGYMALYQMGQNDNNSALYKKQNEAFDIKWETTTQFDVAIEGSLFRRLNYSFEYFDKRSRDLLFDVQLPLSAGATSTSDPEATITRNIGTIVNRGVEIDLNGDIIQTKSWRWHLGVNATFLKNKIVKLPKQNREKGIIDGQYKYAEGHARYEYWMYQFAGVDQLTGNALYLPNLEDYSIDGIGNGEEELPEDAFVKIGNQYYVTEYAYAKRDWSGSAIPKVYGSFTTALEWNNFTLSGLFTYSLGSKILDSSYRSLMTMSGTPSALHKDILNAWKETPASMTESSQDRINPNGIPGVDYARSSNNNVTSNRFLQNGSYLVVKNITLGYELPRTFVQRLDLSRVTLTASAENLATITAVKGMNPLQSFDGRVYNAYGPARVFSFGININL